MVYLGRLGIEEGTDLLRILEKPAKSHSFTFFVGLWLLGVVGVSVGGTAILLAGGFSSTVIAAFLLSLVGVITCGAALLWRNLFYTKEICITPALITLCTHLPFYDKRSAIPVTDITYFVKDKTRPYNALEVGFEIWGRGIWFIKLHCHSGKRSFLTGLNREQANRVVALLKTRKFQIDEKS